MPQKARRQEHKDQRQNACPPAGNFFCGKRHKQHSQKANDCIENMPHVVVRYIFVIVAKRMIDQSGSQVEKAAIEVHVALFDVKRAGVLPHSGVVGNQFFGIVHLVLIVLVDAAAQR